MRVFTLIATLALIPVAAGADEVLLQANGDPGLYLRQDGKAVKVRDADGRVTPVRFRNRTAIDALVHLDDGWAIVGTRLELENRVLSLVRHDITGTHLWLPPTHEEDTHRVRPSLMVHEGSPVGLVWLEGTDAEGLAVKAADWNGVSWQPAELVAAPGKGSQTALSATVLADGSWLLVWSRFDGDDDEIYWSIRRETTWSDALPVAEDNEVPDIMPAILATADGAMAAWNVFDGLDYSLVAATFDGETWSKPEVLAGGGSLYPAFTRAGDAIFLTYQAVGQGTWNVIEMNEEGEPQRHAAVEEETTERPILLVDRFSRATLAWAAGERADLSTRWSQVIR